MGVLTHINSVYKKVLFKDIASHTINDNLNHARKHPVRLIEITYYAYLPHGKHGLCEKALNDPEKKWNGYILNLAI
jgi:hypothetical protein